MEISSVIPQRPLIPKRIRRRVDKENVHILFSFASHEIEH
jgi:hypothetical protein